MIKFFKEHKKVTEILFTAIIFGFICIWAYVQPLNEGPDEGMRYELADYIYQTGRLPHGGDPQIRNPIWGLSYGFTPILSYMISAVSMYLMSFISNTPNALLMAARIVSALFNAGTVYISIQIAKKLFKHGYRVLFVCLTAMLPQVVFIGTYVNNDAMAIFSTAFIVYIWIIGMEKKWDIKSCILLGTAVSICLLSYYNAYGFVLCSVILFSVSILLLGEKKWNFKEWLAKGGLICLVILILAGWWFIRSYIIYDGDILGMSTSSAYSEMYAIDGFKPSQRLTPANCGESLWSMLAGGWLITVYTSFIGNFGHMLYPLHILSYLFYTITFFIGLAGVFIYSRSIFRLFRDKKLCQEGVFHLVMLLAAVIPNVLNMYYSYTSDYQPQGRYSLPMLIPFMYFIVLGISKLLDRIEVKLSERMNKEVLAKIKKTIIGCWCLGIAGVLIFSFCRIILVVY